MAAGRFTESWSSSTSGTARLFRTGKPVTFSIPTYSSGTIYLKVSTDGGSNYDTMKSFTAATTEEQSFYPVSEIARYRFDCSGTGLGNALVIHGDDISIS
jgi:hypothetical protein